MDVPEYLTTAELSALLRTPVNTLYQWKMNGYGPTARRVGVRLLYRRDEVIAWVEAQPSGR